MNRRISIGIFGDYDVNRPSHIATNNAIEHASKFLGIDSLVTWLPTPSFLTEAGQRKLEQYDAVWASPGSPYQSMEGAIRAIHLAREIDRPFIGT